MRGRNRAGSTSLRQESLVGVAVGEEITEERVWSQLTPRPMSEPSVLNPPVVDVGFMTCSYTVITHLSRPADDEAAMSHQVTEP